MKLLALGFAMQSLSGVSAALLRRHLDFRRLFFIDVGGSLLGYGGVAVALALLGYGVWSLAWANLVQSAVRSAALLISMRHPMRPLLGRAELRGLLHFGVGGTAVVAVNYFALNGDNFVVGRWSGAESLGLYARAYTLMNLPFTHVSNVMSSVLFPALAKVQHDPVRLRRAYLLLTELLAMVAGPAMATLGIAAPHLVRTLYGPQWLGVAAPLQILCLAGYFRALYHLGGIVAQSAGRVYSELRRQVVYAVLVIGGAFVGLRYGLPGVAAAVGIAILFMFLATGQLCLGITRTPWAMYFRVQRAAVFTALVTLCVVASLRWLLERLEYSSATIAFAVLSGAAVPWSAGLLWTLGRPDFEWLRDRLPKSVRQLSLWMARGGNRQAASET